MHDALASDVRRSAIRRPSHVKPYRQFKRFLRGDNRSLARSIAQQLTPRVETLARELLGEPRARNGRTWRFGHRGSLVLDVAGERAGRWFSFEENKGGDALDLIAFARRESLRDALAFARAWLGGRQ